MKTERYRDMILCFILCCVCFAGRFCFSSGPAFECGYSSWAKPRRIQPDEMEIESQGEHIRFEALHSALSYALQKTLSKLTLKTFVSCYPEIDHHVLDYVRKQILKSWQTRAEAEFQKIFTERGLKGKLDDLDTVIQNAEKRKKKFEHESRMGGGDGVQDMRRNISALSPSELSKMYIVTEKQKSLELLHTELQAIKGANEELLARIEGFKREIDSNVSEYGPVTDDLKVLDDIDETSEEAAFKEMVEWAVEELTKFD